ncbi:MAG: KH domain-containing protein [bacterium]
MAELDQEFVEYVVKAIVEHPESASTTRRVDERGVLIELSLDQADMGQVIGKEGRTAKALRTLLRVLGAKNNSIVNLKIIEPEGGKRSESADKPADSLETPAI